jgi:hypothetical protein
MRIIFDKENGTTTIVSGKDTIVLTQKVQETQQAQQAQQAIDVSTSSNVSTEQNKNITISGFGKDDDDDDDESILVPKKNVRQLKHPKTSDVGPETMTSCMSLKKNGEQCGRTTKQGEAYCFFHSSTCTAVTSKGLKCSNGCMEGTDRCSYHAATCPGRTKSGEPCQLAAEFCRYHRSQVDEPPTYTEVLDAKNKSVAKAQCAGQTKKGHRCRLKVQDHNSDFCHFHS